MEGIGHDKPEDTQSDRANSPLSTLRSGLENIAVSIAMVMFWWLVIYNISLFIDKFSPRLWRKISGKKHSKKAKSKTRDHNAAQEKKNSVEPKVLEVDKSDAIVTKKKENSVNRIFNGIYEQETNKALEASWNTFSDSVESIFVDAKCPYHQFCDWLEAKLNLRLQRSKTECEAEKQTNKQLDEQTEKSMEQENPTPKSEEQVPANRSKNFEDSPFFDGPATKGDLEKHMEQKRMMEKYRIEKEVFAIKNRSRYCKPHICVLAPGLCQEETNGLRSRISTMQKEEKHVDNASSPTATTPQTQFPELENAAAQKETVVSIKEIDTSETEAEYPVTEDWVDVDATEASESEAQ
ncbi:hypothetical protein EG329_004969 [Mollisiaceae sp. DMI_Dod_QoI]|nr:hypothetical protein EG329_004969 [Helotiales sp. DMI_Dod_QoI]